jgi:dTMP kinase
MFLHSPRKLLLLHGKPRSGKTTLLEYLFQWILSLNLPYYFTGFITREVKEAGERVGFNLVYLRDPDLTLPLAQLRSLTPSKKYPVLGKYSVFPQNLDKILEIIQNDLTEANRPPLLFIDEIGKMEVMSEKFIQFLEHLREEVIVVATLGTGKHPLLKAWREIKSALYCEVTPENRDFLQERLKVEFQRKGKLFVLEGIDGVGKSTIFQMLKEDLSFSDLIFSFEPTTGPYGQKLRRLLSEKKADPRELLNLFISDRKEHVEKLILPALKKGKPILLDRYYLSTVAYQGVEFSNLLELLRTNETFAPLPDLVIYLDLSVEQALQRVISRNQGKSLFEREEFLRSVSHNYEEILPLFRHVRLPAWKTLESLYSDIKELIQSYLRPEI